VLSYLQWARSSTFALNAIAGQHQRSTLSFLYPEYSSISSGTSRKNGSHILNGASLESKQLIRKHPSSYSLPTSSIRPIGTAGPMNPDVTTKGSTWKYTCANNNPPPSEVHVHVHVLSADPSRHVHVACDADAAVTERAPVFTLKVMRTRPDGEDGTASCQ